jgi:multiple sugar transport system ATP-binding protein
VFLGFRPENFLPRDVYGPQDNLMPLQFKVTRVEYLGSDRLLYGFLGGKLTDAHAIAKLPSNVALTIHQGETYEFVVQEKDLKFFDKDTGLRTAPRPL